MDTGAAGDTRHYPVRGQAVELENGPSDPKVRNHGGLLLVESAY